MVAPSGSCSQEKHTLYYEIFLECLMQSWFYSFSDISIIFLVSFYFLLLNLPFIFYYITFIYLFYILFLSSSPF